MIDAWIPLTLGAAFAQALRTALQKRLAGKLSVNASAFVRFLFGMPFALAWAAGLMAVKGAAVPAMSAGYMLWVVIAAVAQILATALLLAALGRRNFPVGVALSKTEIVQAALFGLLFLGDRPSLWAMAAIVIATFGVVAIVLKGGGGGLDVRTAVTGLASGACFALSAVGFRVAALSLQLDDAWVAAAYTLGWATVLQTLLMGGYLAWRERAQFRLIGGVWRPALLAGFASAAGSIGWFTAMTLQAVAYVRTLGLVELIFTFAFSFFWFGEKPRGREVFGILLLAIGIAMILNPH